MMRMPKETPWRKLADNNQPLATKVWDRMIERAGGIKGVQTFVLTHKALTEMTQPAMDEIIAEVSV